MYFNSLTVCFRVKGTDVKLRRLSLLNFEECTEFCLKLYTWI